MAKKLRTRKSYVTIIDQATNEILGEEFLSYNETFDEQENLLEETELDADGNILGRALYSYNEKGKIVTRESFLEGNIPNEKEVFQYLDDEIASIELIYSGGGVSKRIYNRKEGETEILLEDDDGVSEGSELRKFSASGELTEQTVRNEHGDIELQKLASYDAHDNVTELKIYGAEEDLMEWQTFEYDDQQREVKRVLFSPNGDVRGGVTIEYNDDGKVLRQKAIDKLSGGGNYERLFSYEDNEEWMEMYDGSETLVRQHYKKYNADRRIVLEETSKVPRSGMYSPADNSRNYFVIRNEFSYWD